MKPLGGMTGTKARLFAIGGVVASTLLISGVTTAHAEATRSTAVGGQGNVTVTVWSNGAGANCQVRIDGVLAPNSQFLVFADPGSATKVVDLVPGGTHNVNAFCNGTDLPVTVVTVQATDPLQDFIARLLRGQLS
jgi:hypothetical protein